MALSIDETLESFFFDQLEDAQDEGAPELPEEVEAYVVRLLAEYARRPEVAGRTSAPLALQLLAAREDGASALRAVGDRAVYIAGVVPGSLRRGPVNVRYVRAIGATAYGELHQRVSSLTVFRELAASFSSVTQLVGRMVEHDREESLLDVYERWRQRGESRDTRRLVAAGVLLDPDRSDVLQ